jgi:hypothetical protein
MDIKKQIASKKQSILNDWFKSVIDSYPGETKKYFIKKDKQFANPVGHTIFHNMEIIFGEILKSKSDAEFDKPLDEILKIRNVQDCSASEAVQFIFDLKAIVRKELKAGQFDKKALLAIRDFEDGLDQLSCKAFDIYMKAKELLYDIRANEIRKRNSRMVERLNMKYDYLENEINKSTNS